MKGNRNNIQASHLLQQSGAALVAFLAVMLSGLAVAGCGTRVPYFALIPKSQTAITSGRINNKVDILWVIDNYGTMGPKQDNLAQSINSFMSQFVSKELDYRIAVVTTDIRPVDPEHPTDPNYSGQGACFVGSPAIVTPATADPITTLGNNAKVGFYGAADAHGLDAVRLALSEPNLSGCNQGFLRSDAFLAVIEFSDADDNTTATPEGLVAFLDTIKQPFLTESGAQVRSYFASGMVVDDLGRQECIDLGPFSELGFKFIQLANLTGGTISSICEPDFSDGLLSVSNKILEAATAVTLYRKPNLSTVVIRINGVFIPADPVNGWTFEETTNQIYLHGSAIPVGEGNIITVDYTPEDIAR